MDYLAHEPEVLLHGGGFTAQLLHEVEVQYICAVQADAVDVEFIDPEADYVEEVLPHRGVKQIQAGQFEVSLPGLEAEGIAQGALPVEVDSLVPVFVGGVPAFLADVAEGEEFPACVVEHAVHHHLDPALVAEGHKFFKVAVVAQTPVHQLVIPGVVTVAGGLEQRSYVDGVETQLV